MAEDLSLFQEIDDSLRVEKLQQFWERFGNLVIGACVGVVLVTVGVVVWKNHRTEIRAQQTSVLLRAQELMAEGKFADAAHMLEGSADTRGNVAELTGLELAQAYLKSGNKDKALATYTEVSHSSSDRALRDYASLQVGLLTGKAPEVSEGSPYSSEANEIKAVQLIKAGKPQEARGLLKPITEDDHAPASQRERAEQILDSLPENGK